MEQKERKKVKEKGERKDTKRKNERKKNRKKRQIHWRKRIHLKWKEEKITLEENGKKTT